MGALQKLFTAHGADYLRQFGEAMPGAHRKVMAAMVACRTPQAGALLCGCAHCGQPHLLPRSCGNRHCPTCQGRKAFEWLARQLERALPTHHFMLTFTVPEPLRAFLRSNQRVGYERRCSRLPQAPSGRSRASLGSSSAINPVSSACCTPGGANSNTTPTSEHALAF